MNSLNDENSRRCCCFLGALEEDPFLGQVILQTRRHNHPAFFYLKQNGLLLILSWLLTHQSKYIKALCFNISLLVLLVVLRVV